MKNDFQILACWIAMMISQGVAAAVELDCPASIDVSQAITETPSTWVADNSRRPHKLNGAGFTYGPPADIGILRPDDKSMGKLRIATYYFDGSPGSYWLNCDYEGTAVTVGKPVPKEIKQCGVVYEVGRSGQWKFQSIQCK